MILSKEKILKISAWVCFISLIFQLVGGLWPQISMFLFGGKLLFYNIWFKFLFLIGISVSFYVKRAYIKGKLLYSYILFFLYLLFDFFYFKFNLNYNIEVILFGFNSFFFWFMLIPFSPSLSGVIAREKILYILMLIFTVSVIFGALQHSTNSSIVPISSIDGRFKILCESFYSRIRAFSFFSYTFDFVLFVTILSLFFIGLTEKKVFKFFILCIIIFVGYISFLRNAYLLVISSLLSYFIIEEFKIKEKYFRYLPIAWFFAGFFIVVFLSIIAFKKNPNYGSINEYSQILVNNVKIISDFIKQNDFSFLNLSDSSVKQELIRFSSEERYCKIDSPDSFIMRLNQWRLYSKLLSYDIKYLFFGLGLFGGRVNLENYAIDNFYLNTIVHIGLIGFILVLLVFCKLWRFLVSLYFLTTDLYLKSFIIVSSGFLLVSFFDEQFLPNYSMYLILGFMLLNDFKYGKSQ